MVAGFTTGENVFTVVDAGALVEPANHPPRFVLLEGAICSRFVAEDPFALDDISSGWPGNELPCLVAGESCKLFTHSSEPVGIAEGATDRSGDRRDVGGRSSGGHADIIVGVLTIGAEDAGACARDDRTSRRRGRIWI